MGEQKRALVAGAGGFIGSHLVKRLKDEGYWVRGVDLKYPEFSETKADEFYQLDLRDTKNVFKSLKLNRREKFDHVYQLAADMGGAIYIFTGENDYEVMHNSAKINVNFSEAHDKYKRLFYSSSACIYPEEAQLLPGHPGLKEKDAYPAHPDSEYGWEKLFSERLYGSLMRNKGTEVRITRFHNIYGPEGSWKDGREKAPARLSRQVAEMKYGLIDAIQIYGDGNQTRSFLYIDEAVEGVRRLMDSDYSQPLNIGSNEDISINDLAHKIAGFDDVKINLKYDPKGPIGVRGRNSNNDLIKEKLGWAPDYSLTKGIEQTYRWIEPQVRALKESTQ